MFKIIMKFNLAVVKVFEISKPETTFGRAPDNDIVIDNAAVSSHHGKIAKVGDHYEVTDLDSTNGTSVNGRPTKNSKIRSKDQIRVARHVLEVWSDEDPPEAEQDKPVKSPSSAKERLAVLLAQGAEDVAKEEANKAESKAPQSDFQSEAPGPKTLLPLAYIKVISGQAGGESQITLGPHVTYIGTSDQAAIKIKGFMAPSLAAAITRRPEGYYLKAVKAGYPKVNGMAISEQIILESGALIEVGGTNLLFQLEKPKTKDE